jgi:ketosteroid isomerase-like protein
VSLRYSSQPINAAGEPAGPAAQADLRNRYVFGRDGDTWRVVSFSPLR